MPLLANKWTVDSASSAMRDDVFNGLSTMLKSVPSKWLYDSLGIDLFDQISKLPEYYVTRAETEILQNRSMQIAAETGADTLVDLGSGAFTKTRLLLNALGDRLAPGNPKFVAFDVDDQSLSEGVAAIRSEYPELEVVTVCGDFLKHLSEVPTGGRRLFSFLGQTVGNLMPSERTDFFAALAAVMGPGDSLLLGADLVKNSNRMLAAYDDPAGLNAAFDRNLLVVINREFDADFDLDAYEHVVRWNCDEERVEMAVRAVRRQRVNINDLGLTVEFAEGEELLTDVSYKFRPGKIAVELAAAGLFQTRWWTDDDGDFGLSLAFANAELASASWGCPDLSMGLAHAAGPGA